MWDLAQVFAHQRHACFFESHIFTHPAFKCDSAQWQ
jgi:hypothetical protein